MSLVHKHFTRIILKCKVHSAHTANIKMVWRVPGGGLMLYSVR